MAKKTEVSYEPRENLDSALDSAIAEILSAEQEARSITEQGEAQVKAIQLDGAARERTMRENAARYAVQAADKAKSEAAARATVDCDKIRRDAEETGKALIKSKQKEIAAVAAEYFARLGGK